MTLKYFSNETPGNRPEPARTGEDSESAPSGLAGIVLDNSGALCHATQDARTFISDIRGHHTRWPALILASLLTVCLVGFSTSYVLFNEVRLYSTTSAEQTGTGEESSGSPAIPDLPKGEEQLHEAQARKQVSAILKKKKRKSMFAFQSEAEAAPETPLSLAALQSMAAGESYMDLGDYTKAVAAYERALSIDPQMPDCSEKLSEAKKSLSIEQAHDVLSSVKTAVESENLEALLSLLDENETDLVRLQKAKAKLLFRRFDEINGTYSGVKINVLNDNELAIKLHCKVEAALARSGRPIVLSDGDQAITLKKVGGSVWKICAIEE